MKGAVSGAEGARIGRIEAMETLLNECAEAVAAYAEATERFGAIQEKIRILSDYIGGETWFEDREADEQGRLPQGLRRGVLTEDLGYDVIVGNRDVAIRMLEIATDIMKNL